MKRHAIERDPTLREIAALLGCDSLSAQRAVGYAEKPKEIPERFLRAEARSSEYVYFIRQDDDGPIKIGISYDPWKRMANLQGANASLLKLLAFEPAKNASKAEQELHERFASSRLNGEWFVATPELLAHIKGVRTPEPTERECNHCASTFVPTTKRSRFCSLNCRAQQSEFNERDLPPKQTLSTGS